MKKEQKKMNNKGFSLVELIIVMAIMAILVGVVGTQVIPYLNNAKQSKDYQVISSYGTAAMTAYTEYAEYAENVEFSVYPSGTPDTSTFTGKMQKKVQELTYSGIDELKDALKSTAGEAITGLKIKVEDTQITVTVEGTDAFDPVVSPLGN
jgi:type IV pilus assembly protein PilA